MKDPLLFSEFASPRLLLRPPMPEDAPALFAIRSDSRVNAFIDRQPEQAIEETIAFIAKIQDAQRLGQSAYWVLCLAETKALIGTVCLWRFSEDRRTAELGYELHPDFQGMGLMQEALQGVLDFAFRSLRLEKITAVTHRRHLKSQQLLLRNGFRIDPELAQEELTEEERESLLLFFLESGSAILSGD